MMKNITNKFVFVIFLLSVLLRLQCFNEAKNTNEEIFPREQFIKLYTESLILKYSELSFENIDSSLVQLYQKYNLTEETYKQIENYYKENPQDWLEILAEIDKRIRKFSEKNEVKNEEKN